MQNTDGGWAAFDRGCDREILTYVPFADHNAMIDPSTSDITARLVEVMMHLEVDPQAPEIRRAVGFLRAEQEADRQLVRPLGLQLHLRNLARSGGPGGGR